MVQVMTSFLAGLFVGEGTWEQIRDNLDLERWFRLPKGHERRIHGHRHAGIRIVLEGPTLVHALDAHAAHPGPFTIDDLLPYRAAREPQCQQQALGRRKIMGQVPPHPDRLKDETVARATTSRSVIRWTCSTCTLLLNRARPFAHSENFFFLIRWDNSLKSSWSCGSLLRSR
jgi:hypothetical protein